MNPTRFFVTLAIPLGLLVVFVMPPWTGYDEPTHFARAVDMSEGHITPGRTASCPDGSPLSETYRQDQDRVSENFVTGQEPVNLSLFRALLDHRPGTDEGYCVDTQPTTASTPAGYIPAALGMAIPNALRLPGATVLWAGRLADLAVYVGIVAAALAGARAFTWTIAIAALFPLNLALGASVSPDGLTIAALLLVLSVWTRQLDDHPSVGRAVAEVGGAGLLLALAKPPYFLVLALFPVLLWRGATRPRIAAAAVSVLIMTFGLGLTLANSENNYEPVTQSLNDSITYQPEVQRERLIEDPIEFLSAVGRTTIDEADDYVSDWTRQLGFYETQFSAVFAWVVLVIAGVAALRLDLHDYQRVRGRTRAAFVLGCAAFVLLLYASAYIYFDDTLSGDRIGDQMGRYSLVLIPLGMIGLWPRNRTVASFVHRSIRSDHMVSALTGVLLVAFGGATLTWLWWGSEPSLAALP